MKPLIAIIALIATGCGSLDGTPMLNGKPVLSVAKVSDSFFVITGQAEYTSPACLKNVAVRYCLHNFNEGATLSMGSPPDSSSAQATFTCSGPTSNTDLTQLSTLGC